jgi:PBSX family phage terminase large subunit
MNNYAPFNRKSVNYLHRTQKSWFNVAEGGKRGGKNVLNALCFCILLENHPNRLHLLGGVSIASVKLNIIDCDGFGITNYFAGRCREGKYKNKDCLYVGCADGQERILLISGGAKDGDEKYIKGNTYGMAYVTEANECHPKFLKEVFDRTISSGNRKVFHDLNPKPPAHWYYTEILDYHEKQQALDENYGYNYEHFNIFDNMSIPDEQLKTILKTYDKTSIWYKRDILGKRIANAGILFDLIANDEERYKTNDRIVGLITCGVDIGKNGSKHAFCSQIISRSYRDVLVIRSDEVDCSNQDGVQDTDGIGVKLKQLKDGFIKHVKYVILKYGKIDYIFVDNAEPTIIDFLQQCLENENIHIPVKPSIKIELEDRIHLIGILLMQDRLKFMDKETKEIIKALQEATQDDKATTDRWLDDGTSDIDILDGFIYGIENWSRELMLL